ncbi:MAG: aspartate--tRNA(Asn) ligase, partial [Thermofilum sp.]
MEKRIVGWVSNLKVLGRISFLEVIDDLSVKPLTVVVKRDEVPEEIWRTAVSLKLGSAVRVIGREPEKVISMKGRELHAVKVEVLSEPQALLPLDPTGKTPASFDAYIDYRYLSLRLPRFRALFL